MVDDESICGGGYLRVVEFLPDGNSVQVKSYSLTLHRELLAEQLPDLECNKLLCKMESIGILEADKMLS